jgi:hypothetical protein
MADNTTLNSGTGGDVIATDDIAGVKYQIVKLAYGALDTATLVSSANPVPVNDASGSLTVDNAGTFATQETGAALTALQLIDNIVLAEDAASVSGDPGVLALAVRQDADATSVSASGDYTALQVDANGYLKVNIKAGAGSGGTALADAAAFTRGTTSATPVSARVETSAPTLTNGNSGVLSLTTGGALRVDISSGGVPGFAEDAAATSGDTGVQILAVRQDTLASSTSTDGDYASVKVNNVGRVYTSATVDAALPAGSNVIGALTANQSVNVAQINGVTPLMGSGATGTGSHRVTIATDGQGQLVDNAAFTDGTTRVDVAGFIFDETAGTALTENDVAAARVDSKRAIVMVTEDGTTRGQRQAVNSSGGASVTIQTHTSGGPSLARVAAAASTNATSTKASAGQVYGWTLINTSAAYKFVKFYNKASAPTVGTDTPVFTIPVPASSGVNIEYSTGIPFATGIAWAITNLVADSDTTAVSANDVHGFIIYK